MVITLFFNSEKTAKELLEEVCDLTNKIRIDEENLSVIKTMQILLNGKLTKDTNKHERIKRLINMKFSTLNQIRLESKDEGKKVWKR